MTLPQPQAHEMVLVLTKGDRELWQCPVCQRSFWLVWQPYSKEIVYAGDENATHSGGKGGLRIGGMAVEPGVPDVFAEYIDGMDMSGLGEI